ncbi:hypothetical protein C7B80_25075 [Cyanosarcina cf. burmensis CCALA 770]|nr:hypothetical protein C7B80_25075 [Cyanosarcina cf. burmensis CCALA 770]
MSEEKVLDNERYQENLIYIDRFIAEHFDLDKLPESKLVFTVGTTEVYERVGNRESETELDPKAAEAIRNALEESSKLRSEVLISFNGEKVYHARPKIIVESTLGLRPSTLNADIRLRSDGSFRVETTHSNRLREELRTIAQPNFPYNFFTDNFQLKNKQIDFSDRLIARLEKGNQQFSQLEKTLSIMGMSIQELERKLDLLKQYPPQERQLKSWVTQMNDTFSQAFTQIKVNLEHLTQKLSEAISGKIEQLSSAAINKISGTKEEITRQIGDLAIAKLDSAIRFMVDRFGKSFGDDINTKAWQTKNYMMIASQSSTSVYTRTNQQIIENGQFTVRATQDDLRTLSNLPTDVQNVKQQTLQNQGKTKLNSLKV